MADPQLKGLQLLWGMKQEVHCSRLNWYWHSSSLDYTRPIGELENCRPLVAVQFVDYGPALVVCVVQYVRLHSKVDEFTKTM